MITMYAGEHRRALILMKKMTIFDVETPVSIFANLRKRARQSFDIRVQSNNSTST